MPQLDEGRAPDRGEEIRVPGTARLDDAHAGAAGSIARRDLVPLVVLDDATVSSSSPASPYRCRRSSAWPTSGRIRDAETAYSDRAVENISASSSPYALLLRKAHPRG